MLSVILLFLNCKQCLHCLYGSYAPDCCYIICKINKKITNFSKNCYGYDMTRHKGPGESAYRAVAMGPLERSLLVDERQARMEASPRLSSLHQWTRSSRVSVDSRCLHRQQ